MTSNLGTQAAAEIDSQIAAFRSLQEELQQGRTWYLQSIKHSNRNFWFNFACVCGISREDR
jgi:hypothetical protein